MSRNVTATSHFNRAATLPDRQLDQIRNAYSLAGIQPPTQTTAALEALKMAPSAETVARQLAAEAFHTNDAQDWLDAALAKIIQAQAADALRSALALVGPAVRRSLAPALVDRAATDLAPKVKTLVKSLTDAGKNLAATDPMSLDSAVRDDTTKELKAAQAALGELGVLASIHVYGVSRAHQALAKVLPIVDLPECAVEQIADTFSEVKQALNPGEIRGSIVVRDLTRALERDTDTALLDIARGKYEGVTIALADTLTLRRRTGNAIRSNKREVVTRGRRVTVGS